MSSSRELQIIPIPAMSDNYIWLLHKKNQAVVVDPGDAQPVIEYLRQHKLELAAILVTHYHADHIQGIPELVSTYHPLVFASTYEHYSFDHIPVKDGDNITIPEIQVHFQVMHLPGHTLGHIAYYGHTTLFCGDTLFGGGCGRLFEGSPEQMMTSLQRLAKLPPSTRVFCAHEYTQKNLEFAHTLEPSNNRLIQRLDKVKADRQRGIPSLPSTIEIELETNPFLRCDQSEVINHIKAESTDPITIFTKMREMRNHY